MWVTLQCGDEDSSIKSDSVNDSSNDGISILSFSDCSNHEVCLNKQIVLLVCSLILENTFRHNSKHF